MKKILSGFIVFVFVFLFSNSPTYAKAVNKGDDNYVLDTKEIVNDDLFVTANSTNILGTVNGNLFIGSGEVNVSGTVNGDLFILSGNVNLSGLVKQNVYVVGGNVILNKATIENSLFSASGTLNVDKESVIKGSLLSAAGTFGNKASIGRNLYLAAGTAQIASRVGKDLAVVSGDLTIDKSSRVNGNFYYTLDENKKTFTLPDGVIAGSVNKVETPKSTLSETRKPNKMFNGGIEVFSLLSSLLVGLVVIKLFTDKSKFLSESVLNSLSSNLGTGFLILVATIPASILIMFTIIGFKLGLIVITLYSLATYFAKIVVSLALGKWMFSNFKLKSENQYVFLVVGLLMFHLLKMIPVVGFITSIIFASVGLGAFYKLSTNK